MWQRAFVTLLVLLCACLSVAHASDGRRVALVIGNGAYQNAPALPNPARDASAVAEALRGLDFTVIEATDLDHPDMLARLDEFATRLEDADVGLFYYAGHGLQVAGDNFLVPVDARLQREAQVRLQTVPLETVLAAMESAVPTRLILLDACRDNPLAQALKRGMTASRSSAVGQGLAEVRAGEGTLVAYATAPGDVASDGRGQHSPFTAALLNHIATPGLEVRQLLTRVRADVVAATGRDQTPWDHSSLLRDFYFEPAAAEPPVAAAPAPSPAPGETPSRSPVSFDERQLDLGFWESVRGSDAPEDFAAYLESFPNGVYAVLARRRLAELRPPPEKAAAEPAEPPPEAPKAEPVPPPIPKPTVAARTPEETQFPPKDETVATTLAEPPPPTPAEVEGTLALSRDDWRSLQRAVTALGFHTRGVDGKPGPATRKALAAWQEAKRVEPTGYLGPLQRELILSEAQAELAALEAAQASVPRSAPSIPVPAAVAKDGARPKAGKVFTDCSGCPEMVVIPAGTFTMGSPAGEQARHGDEGPERKVTIDRPFALGRYEVTFAQWDACVAAGGCNRWNPDDLGWGRGQQPVINVSWLDAQAYVTWLANRTGQPYRLPTEAEWEYAARAGTKTPFWTGLTISPWEANYDGRYTYGLALNAVYRERTVRVDHPSFPANLFGLYHMHGNVQEFVQDCVATSYNDSSLDGHASEKDECWLRGARGGSWSSNPRNLRSADRDWVGTVNRSSDLGFRVARTLAP